MAYLIPDVTHMALTAGLTAELKTLENLKSDLSSDFTIFHSVYWSRANASHRVFGEIDFVVLNRSGDVLLIEQKRGPLEERDGDLYKIYGATIKSVGAHLRQTLEDVRQKFIYQNGANARLHLDYLLYCPDHRVTQLNAAALDRNRIVDSSERDQLAVRIKEILGLGSPDERARFDTVNDFFRQTYELVPDIHAHISSQEKQFVRFSGGLSRVLSSIEMTPLRLRIRGSAGSGKTVAASQFFGDVIKAGKRPLLVCFNRPLRENLKASAPAGGMVMTWNGFCDAFLKERGQIDYAEMRSDPSFWKNLSDKITGEKIPPEWMFDALIVDEGQDFEQEWFEILRLFLRDSHDLLWLEDADQNVYDKPPVRLDGFVGYRVRENYRSPQGIARFILQTLPFKFEPANDLPGLGVGVTPYRRAEEQPRLVSEIIEKLLGQGFRDGDIVILTTHSVTPGSTPKSVFSNRESVGRYKLRTMTGEYDLFGNQCMTQGRIAFDSVRRFKGQQSPAVIVVDIDSDPARKEYYDQLLLCAMTRATVRLELLVDTSSPKCERFFQ